MAAEPSKHRRSFSVVQAGGRTECGGQTGLAKGLMRALRAPAAHADLAHALTHGLHSYPARMHPAMARTILEVLAPRSVLDPFCGSGTTLVESRYAGISSAGVDLNPLAILVARAKTWVEAEARREELLALGREIGEGAARAADQARRGAREPRRGGKQRDRELLGWFAPHVRRELESMAGRIDDVADEDLREVLRAVLSAILYKVSQRESDTEARKVERQIARGAPARLFTAKLGELCRGLAELGTQKRGGQPHVLCGDAQRLRALGIGEGAFDAVVTSPPYAGTYDYAEHQRLRIAFFALDPRFRKKEIGARARFADRSPEAVGKALGTWRKEFAAALAETTRAVKPGGHVVIVIGDSLAGDRAVYADDVVVDLCPESLSLEAWARQERPILGAAERTAFAERPKREYLLAFLKR